MTKTLVVDKSVSCGTIVAVGQFTVNATRVFTLSGGGARVFNGPSSISGSFTPGTGSCTFNSTISVPSGGVFGGNTGWTANINGNLTINAGGIWNKGTGTTTVAVNVTVLNQGTANMNGGNLYGTSIVTSILQNLATWNWTGTMNIKLFNVQFDVSQGAASTVSVTGNMNIYGWSVSAGGTFACTSAGVHITVNPMKDIINNATMTFTGGAGNNIVISGYRSIQQNNTTVQTWQYLTLTGQNATTAWNNGPDVSIGTGAHLQASNLTLTFNLIGMQATSGWFVSKVHNGVANTYMICGILNFNAPGVVYRVAGTDNVTLRNADVYQVPFNSVFTINANANYKTMVHNHNTSVIVNNIIQWLGHP
jgi:hypothetical protein